MPSPLLKIPSRLSPDYVKKTLARLIPFSDEEIAHLSKDQLGLLEKELDEYEVLINNDPVRFFRPNPGGQYDFMTCDEPTIKGLFFFAGNKTGKTTGACIIAGEYAVGRPLWVHNRPVDMARWSAFHRKPPLRIAHFTEDFSSHDETIIPTYLSWLPKGEVTSVPRSPSGNYVQIRFKNGSVIFLRTYDQGYDKAEGKDYDLVVCDEPPPRDVFTAVLRGLVATDGRLYIAATLLKEPWLYDEVQHPHNRVFQAEIYENQWLSRSAIENFAASLTDEEKQIRVFGRPTTLTGAIYPEFQDKYPHVTEHHDRLWDPTRDAAWPIVMGVDPHERKPLFCLWGYLTPAGGIIWFDFALVPAGSKEAIFDELKRVEATHHDKCRVVVMDPNRGRAKQIGNTSWQEEFEARDYDVLLGDDNLAVGHGVVHDMLRFESTPDRDKVTKLPRMQFMENLRAGGKRSPIYQMSRYTWEEWARGKRIEKDVKEKPKELNKDFPDVIRYVALAIDQSNISYHDFVNGEPEVIRSSGERPAGRLY